MILIERRVGTVLILLGAFVSCAESPARSSRIPTTRDARRSRMKSEGARHRMTAKPKAVYAMICRGGMRSVVLIGARWSR